MKFNISSLTTFMALAVGLPSWAFGQSAASAATGTADQSTDAGLADIVVTAERRSASAQNTAITITALSPETLSENNVVNAMGLSNVVPGVSAYEGGGFSQIRIRGVGGGVVNAYGEPGVAYNIAGVYLAQPYGGNSSYYDLDRVEVLAGPQGTLYGRNATAGAINVIPARPQIDAFSATAALQFGNYSDVESSGSLNLPLGSTTAVRVAVSTVDHNGYFSSGQSDALTRSARIQLLTKPTDDLSILLYVDYFHEGGHGQGDTPVYPGTSSQVFGPVLPGVTTEFINPKNPWQTLSPGSQYLTGLAPPNATISQLGASHQGHDQTIVTSEINWNLDFATLTVQPAFVKTKVGDDIYNFGYPSSLQLDINQYSAEARLASNATEPFKWVAGAYYYNQSVDSQASFFSEFLGYLTLNTPNLDSRSEAGFGQATYSVTDRFRLMGGLRYTHETKSVDGATISPGVPAAFCPAFIPATGAGVGITDRCAIPNSGDLSFGSTTYKAGVEFDAGPRSLLYATISTGFKAGGFNPGSPPNNTYEPEKLTSYEVGSKNRFLDNHVTFNVSAFYYDDRNEANPVLGPINPLGYAYVVTPAKSHVEGVETELAWKVTSNDTLTANALWQDAKFDSYVAPGVPALGVPTIDYSGHTRPFSPRWSGYTSYEHEFGLTSDSQLVYRADLNFKTRSIVLAPSGYEQGGYAKANMSLDYRFNHGRYAIGAFVNNLTDRFTVPYAAISAVSGTTFAQGEPPRTYGIKLRAEF